MFLIAFIQYTYEIMGKFWQFYESFMGIFLQKSGHIFDAYEN